MDVNVVPRVQGDVQNCAAQEKNTNVEIALKCPVRRKYRFINWLMTGQNPPLQLSSRYQVSDLDIIHYSVMVELAHSPHKKYVFLVWMSLSHLSFFHIIGMLGLVCVYVCVQERCHLVFL